MTADEVIQEIQRMPRDEQSRVLDFAAELKRGRQLSGAQLASLAQQMVDSSDPAEVERLKGELTRGFYGD